MQCSKDSAHTPLDTQLIPTHLEGSSPPVQSGIPVEAQLEELAHLLDVLEDQIEALVSEERDLSTAKEGLLKLTATLAKEFNALEEDSDNES